MSPQSERQSNSPGREPGVEPHEILKAPKRRQPLFRPLRELRTQKPVHPGLTPGAITLPPSSTAC
jgi:hypothetical protein